MRRSLFGALLCLAGAAASVPASGTAQEPDPLQPGAAAPDFSLPGAVRYGVLAEPVQLSDFEGKTVVLAFFFRARTKG